MSGVVYLDASAAAKLTIREAESGAVRSWLRDHPDRVSSSLLRTELIRAVRRAEPAHVEQARRVVGRITLLAVDTDILDNAAMLDPLGLRSLDAIHLATALRLAEELDALVTYDRRMIEAATLLGLPVASPA